MTRIHGKRGVPAFFAALFSIFVLSFATSSYAQGGPPMLTDDPGTPGAGRWEVNFLSTLERSRNGSLFETPNIDVNFGIGNHLQLKFEAPWLVMKESGEQRKVGPGNSMIGVKWRFLGEERRNIDMSVYPQLEFNNPTGSAERGLVERGVQLFLPVEAVKKVGPVKVNGEIGYRFVQHGHDELEYGLAIARQVTSRIELIGELHGSALKNLREDELFFNAGSRLRLSRNTALLFSAGQTIRNQETQGARYIATFGLQVNFTNRIFSGWKGK